MPYNKSTSKKPSRRNPGFGEYLDHLGRIRSHLAEIPANKAKVIKKRKLINGVTLRLVDELYKFAPTPPP